MDKAANTADVRCYVTLEEMVLVTHAISIEDMCKCLSDCVYAFVVAACVSCKKKTWPDWRC